VTRCLTYEEGKNKTSEAGKLVATLTHSNMEIGPHHHGFYSGHARTNKHHDAIWVIVDRLAKSAHFLAVKFTSTAEQLADLYLKEIVRLHEIPLSIVSD